MPADNERIAAIEANLKVTETEIELSKYITRLQKRIADLEGDVERLKADSARLDWLEDHVDCLSNVRRDVQMGTTFEMDYISDESGCLADIRAASVREIIDAAMERTDG